MLEQIKQLLKNEGVKPEYFAGVGTLSGSPCVILRKDGVEDQITAGMVDFDYGLIKTDVSYFCN